jgi:hypothetical protein
MLEGKKGNLHLFVERTPLVGDVAVCISVKAKINSCCLNKLKGSCSCNCFPQGSEEACLCYSLYLVVKNALCGDPLATAKSKVGDVECGAHNGQFFMTWKVKGTGSAVRKSLGMALKCLAPGKIYSVYSHCVKEVGGSANRSCFNYVADELTKSIKDQVHCGVVGNIRLHKKDPKTGKLVKALDIDEMLLVLHKKLNPSTVKGAKHEPKEHTACDHADKSEVKVSGWQAFVVKDYISARVKGLTPVVCDKYILLPIGESRWDTLAKKIKGSVKDYVQQKHAKVKDELPAVMGYMALASASIGCSDVQQMIKSSVKASDVERAINSAL